MALDFDMYNLFISQCISYVDQINEHSDSDSDSVRIVPVALLCGRQTGNFTAQTKHECKCH